jgi:hypothetical protein
MAMVVSVTAVLWVPVSAFEVRSSSLNVDIDLLTGIDTTKFAASNYCDRLRCT